MRANLSPRLVARLRCADPTARIMVEADVTTAEDLRQRKDQWNAADSLTGLTVLEDGQVQLSGTVGTTIQNATSDSEIQDLDAATPFAVARIVWSRALDVAYEIRQITCHLDPKRSGSNAIEVDTWKLQLYALMQVDYLPGGVERRHLTAMGDAKPMTARGTAAGDVIFDFSTDASRPRPGSFPVIVMPFDGAVHDDIAPTTYLFITALKADGSAAGNVGWSYDTGVASVTTSAHTLSGRNLTRSETGQYAGTYADTGSAGGTPRCAIKSGSFADATLTLSAGSPLTLPAAPTADVQFRGHVLAPAGTSGIFEVRNDADNAWVAFLDGRFNTDLAGVGKNATYKVRCRLLTNAAQTLTPVLVDMGVREVTRFPLWDVATIRSARWGIDPISLKGEIPEAVIGCRRDGTERDFQDRITKLLSEYDIGLISFRAWMGADDLPLSDWLHIDDWPAVDDYDPDATEVRITALSALAFARQALPRYIPEAAAAPTSDVSNPGSWVNEAASGTDIYKSIDEQTANDADFITTANDPADAAFNAGLATVTDPQISTNHQVAYRYSKDVAAGKTITLVVRLLEGTTVRAQKVLNNISESWTTGSFDLTPAEADSITSYSALRLQFSANTTGAGGSRKARVSWARFFITGRREPLTYTNQSLKDVWDDLAGVQMRDLLPRYVGPGVEDDSTLVAKRITDSDAKVEADAIAFLAGMGHTTSQGRIKAVSMLADSARAVVAVFRSSEIEVRQAAPGFRNRIPEVFLRYDFNETAGEFRGEARGFHATALTKLGLGRVDPPHFIDDEIGKYVSADAGVDDSLARTLVQRHADAFGAGLPLFSFRSNYAYPELEIGDLIAVEQEKFVAKAPNTGKALKGQLYAIGVITRQDDAEGHDFTMSPRSFDDILSSGEAALRLGFARPIVTQIGLTLSGSGAVTAAISARDARSVRIATSISAFPSAATVRSAAAVALDAAGNYVTSALATIASGQTLYVGVLAYETSAGEGAESDLGQNQITFASAPSGTAPKLTSFTAAWFADGTSCGSPGQIKVDWTANGDVVDGSHDLVLYRELIGLTSRVQVGSTVTTPVATLTRTDDVEDWVTGGPSDTFYTWRYSYELVRQSDGAILDSRTAADVTEPVSGLCPF